MSEFFKVAVAVRLYFNLLAQTTLGGWYLKEHGFTREAKTSVAYLTGVYPLRHPVVHDISPAAPPSPMLLPSAIGTAMDIGIKVVGARNQFGLVPKEDSLVNNKENLVGDAGLMMGRSFRVGWGPGFVLVHSGTPLGKQEKPPAAPATHTSLMGDFLTSKPRPSSSDGAPAFGVTIEKLNVASHFSHGSDTVLVRLWTLLSYLQSIQVTREQ